MEMAKTAVNRARSAGRGLAPKLNAATVVMSRQQIENEFDRIDRMATSDAMAIEMRRAAIDRMLEATNNGSEWDRYYSGVSFIRDSEWYWRERGFNSFEEFWHQCGGKAFGEFSELENLYNFAKTACPDLFKMDVDQAMEAHRLVATQAATLSRVLPLKSHGGEGRANKIKAKSSQAFFDSAKDAKDRLIGAASYVPASGSSLERRFARIRRDRPDVASDLLTGKYIKKVKSGLWEIDIAAAELLVYGKKDSTKKAIDKNRSNSPHNLVKMLKKVIAKHSVDEVIAAVNAESYIGVKLIRSKKGG
jgi:hypothetical protein